MSPSKTLASLVCRRIRELRRERGMTQEELCERAGISVDAVSRIEGGKRTPNLDTLQRLSEAFGVPAAALFEGAPAPSERPLAAPIRRVATLLETQPSDVLTLAESVVTAVVRAYGAGTSTTERSGSKKRKRGRAP